MIADVTTTALYRAHRDRFALVPCPLCGSERYAVRYPCNLTESALLAIAGDFTYGNMSDRHHQIAACADCGHLYANPRDPEHVIAAAYRDVVDPVYDDLRATKRRSFAANLRRVRAVAAKGGALLDVGCATGEAIAVAAEFGFRCAGVEPSRWSADIAARATEATIHATTFEDAPLAPDSFDVVTLWDVIEHVPDPRAVIRRAATLLRPGGIVALTTPDMASLPARTLGGHFWFLERVHLNYFTRRSLARLLAESGFLVVSAAAKWKTYPLRYYCGYLRKLSPRLSRLLVRLVGLARLADVPVPLPSGDMIVCARKR